MRTVVVVAGGPCIAEGVRLPPGATVIAADGGANAGLPIDLVVGDLDSIAPAALAGVARVERYPAVKDATDLDLALQAALRLDPERILVLGSGGGRLDHLFSSLLLVATAAYARVQVDAQLGRAAVHVVRQERFLVGAPGEVISLFAVHGEARGVVTDGLVYPLCGETLVPGGSRGVSNVFGAAQARIALTDGVIVAIRPDGSVQAGSSS